MGCKQGGSSWVKQYLNDVAELPCMLCGAQPVELHHPRTGQGMSQRANDYLVIPLCPECHRGHNGVHGNQSLLKIQKLNEMDL